MSDAINAVAATVGDEIKSFRSAAVTSENRATPLARSILASLLSGIATPEKVVSMVLHAFGNPTTPAGKPLKNLSGSGDHIVGFGATRKTVATILTIASNVDADAGTAGAIRPLVTSFILGDKSAPKSLKALSDAVKDAIAADVAATAPDNSDAVTENEANAPAPADATPVMTFAERVAMLVVEINAMSPADVTANDATLAVLSDAMNAAYTRATAPDLALAA